MQYLPLINADALQRWVDRCVVSYPHLPLRHDEHVASALLAMRHFDSSLSLLDGGSPIFERFLFFNRLLTYTDQLIGYYSRAYKKNHSKEVLQIFCGMLSFSLSLLSAAPSLEADVRSLMSHVEADVGVRLDEAFLSIRVALDEAGERAKEILNAALPIEEDTRRDLAGSLLRRKGTDSEVFLDGMRPCLSNSGLGSTQRNRT